MLRQFFLTFFLLITTLFSNTNSILLKIEGTIDNGLPLYIKRGIKEAQSKDAKYIIFEINTFGGRVDAATEIKDAILNSKIPTIAFINKRAISAGSLIALSCNKIIMMEGSSIGATTVVDQNGKKMSEKSQSYMRAEMSSTAEKNNRRTDIVKAMVDEDIEILDKDSSYISKKGKLLTLTAKEALKYNICDKIIKSKEELYNYLEIKNTSSTTIETSIAEKIVRFLTNPIVSSILLSLGILGLFFEIKTAGWGIGGTIAICSLALFFGSRYILDLANYIDIILFFVGLILVALETFVIPGFGIAGIAGGISIFASFYLSFINDYSSYNDFIMAGATISSSIVVSIIGIYLMFKYLPKSKTFNFLIVNNKEESNSAVKIKDEYEKLKNKEGIAITDLRLSGKIQIENKTYQAISSSNYIEKGDKIQVTNIEGNNIYVNKL